MDIITLLPASWQDVAHAIAGVIASASLLAAAAKPWLGEPSPSDGPAKRMLFGLVQIVDWLAANSRTVASQKEIAKLKRESLL